MPSVPFIGYVRDQEGNGVSSATIQAYAITDLASNTKGADALASTTPDSQTGRWNLFVNTDNSPTGYVSIRITVGNIVRWIEGDATMQAQRFFAEHGEAPILEDSITDAHLGTRTINQNTVPTGNSGDLTAIISGLANRIKAITGATNWYTNPATTLAALDTHNHDAVYRKLNTSIVNNDIANGTIAEAKLSSAVQNKLNSSGGGGGGELTTNSVATSHIQNGAVTDAKIASVSGSKLSNGSVTEAKLSSSVQSKLNASGGGGGIDSTFSTSSSADHSVATSLTTVLSWTIGSGTWFINWGAESLSSLNSQGITLALYAGGTLVGRLYSNSNGSFNYSPAGRTDRVVVGSSTSMTVRAQTDSGSGAVSRPFMNGFKAS